MVNHEGRHKLPQVLSLEIGRHHWQAEGIDRMNV